MLVHALRAQQAAGLCRVSPLPPVWPGSQQQLGQHRCSRPSHWKPTSLHLMGQQQCNRHRSRSWQLVNMLNQMQQCQQLRVISQVMGKRWSDLNSQMQTALKSQQPKPMAGKVACCLADLCRDQVFSPPLAPYKLQGSRSRVVPLASMLVPG